MWCIFTYRRDRMHGDTVMPSLIKLGAPPNKYIFERKDKTVRYAL